MAQNKEKKRGAGAVSSILMALAVVFILYGAAVVLTLGTSHWFNFIWFIGAGVLFILSFLFSRNLGMPGILKAIICIIILACLSNFGIFLWHMNSYASAAADEKATWVIVLGAKVNGSTPSVELMARIEGAEEFLRDKSYYSNIKNLPKVIASGGKGEDELISEAAAIANSLEHLGVNADNILIEDKSTTTKENFEFSKVIIEDEGGKTSDSIVIISSGFHLYRATLLAKEAGLENISSVPCRGRLLSCRPCR